jgi:CheY-like chemotaxis protein
MKPIGMRIEGMEDIEAKAFVTTPIRPLHLYNVLVGVCSGQQVHMDYVFEEIYSEIDPHLADKHPLRILLAEDNIINQKIVLRLLAKIGYRADVVSNGLDALKALEKQPYDVVFMDEHMPELSGKETTKRIREKFSPARLRIIALTASSTLQERDSFFAAGMDDFLSKPMHLYELVDALKRCPSYLTQTPHDQKVPSAPPQIAAQSNSAISLSDDLAEDILDDLQELFLVDTEQLLADMEQAIAAGDSTTLERAAHTLKSSSATMGADKLATLCAELEDQLRTGKLGDDVQKMGNYVTKITLEYAQVRQTMEKSHR